MDEVTKRRTERSGPSREGAEAGAGGDRLRLLLLAHLAFVWRLLRRLGIEPGGVDDAAQQVFLVASRKLEQIEPARERAFLTAVAVRTAANARRAERRRPDAPRGDIDEMPAAVPSSEELLDQKQRRLLLDEALDALPLEQRAVLVLVELEGLTGPEVAALLDVPAPTVASRLRRARERFAAVAERLRQRWLAEDSDTASAPAGDARGPDHREEEQP